MSLTDRDRKIVLVIVPLVLLGAFWFLLFSPKRDEAAKAGERLAKAEAQRDKAQSTLAGLKQSRATFGRDYSELVRIGKAIPNKLDMAGLVVQLEAAASGTQIDFTSIATTEAAAGGSAPAPSGSAPAPSGGGAQPPAAPGTGDGSQPAAAGGAPAQSTPGQQVEGAANGVNQANTDAASNTPGSGGGAGGQTATAPAAGGCAPGLECVPLELEFEGRFFDLADFFHEIKRFVRIANNRLEVRGRLITVENLKFSSDSFPMVKAELKATAYLSPATTQSATPAGPQQAAPAAAGQPAPAPPAPPSATATSP
jgi:Tfp pilus assembly protein PilO